MIIYKYKIFHQWAKSEKISDATLSKVAKEVADGHYEASLGKGLYKKRIAKPGRGKSAGYRTLLAFKKDHNTFFIYGFSKNEKSSINDRETDTYKKLSAIYLELTDKQLLLLVQSGELIEVKNEITKK
jgi:hypothetical protein